jgi:methionyl-tRNA formyltransferase
VPQAGEATYAAKVEPGELHLDWERPAVDLHRVIRLGRAWTTFRDRRLIVSRARLRAANGGGLLPGQLDGTTVGTGDGTLELVEVQPEGKGVQDAAAWVRGARLTDGERLGG